jgi:hypothetical protein
MPIDSQVYERFDASSITEVDDARFDHFCKKVSSVVPLWDFFLCCEKLMFTCALLLAQIMELSYLYQCVTLYSQYSLLVCINFIISVIWPWYILAAVALAIN